MHLLGDTDGLLLPLFLLTLLLDVTAREAPPGNTSTLQHIVDSIDVTAREAPPGNTNTLQHIVDSIVGLHDLCGYARAKALRRQRYPFCPAHGLPAVSEWKVANQLIEALPATASTTGGSGRAGAGARKGAGAAWGGSNVITLSLAL